MPIEIALCFRMSMWFVGKCRLAVAPDVVMSHSDAYLQVQLFGLFRRTAHHFHRAWACKIAFAFGNGSDRTIGSLNVYMHAHRMSEGSILGFLCRCEDESYFTMHITFLHSCLIVSFVHFGCHGQPVFPPPLGDILGSVESNMVGADSHIQSTCSVRGWWSCNRTV